VPLGIYQKTREETALALKELTFLREEEAIFNI
jgi:hypothetical protein